MFAMAEQWRLHPTFNGNVVRLIDTPDYLYILSNNQFIIENDGDYGNIYRSLYRYDKDGDTLEWLSRANMLSESVVHTVEYNPENKYLMCVYASGNIDLVYDNGDVVNVPGLMLADAKYSKSVNGITFYPDADEAYLATDFGYIVVDDNKGEIKRTIDLDTKMTSVARMFDKLFVGNAEGLYVANFKNYISATDLQKQAGFESLKRLVPFEDRLYVDCGNEYVDELRYLTMENGNLVAHDCRTDRVLGIERRKNGLLVSMPYYVLLIDNKYQEKVYWLDAADCFFNAGSWEGNEFWLDGNRYGVKRSKVEVDDAGGVKWVSLSEGMTPNASNAFKTTHIVYHPNYGLLVRNQGTNNIFPSYSIFEPDYLCSYRNLEWESRSASYLNPTAALTQYSPNGIVVDPNNSNQIYSGSCFAGLMRTDISDPSKSLRLSRKGDAANGSPNFVGVIDDSQEWPLFSYFSEPAFDSYGNLWVSRYSFDESKAGISDSELWYWTPEDRAASKDAASYKPMKKMRLKDSGAGLSSRVIPFTSSASKNILMYVPGAWEEKPTFIDHKGTLDNVSDDVRVDCKALTDQDGSAVDFNFIMSTYEDPSTGLVWLGLDKGVVYFRPTEIMQTGGTVHRVKVSRNDGTNLADYLLDGVNVNCIISDSSGRKWFGTAGGGIVITSGDGTQVIRSYTTENSELPDDNVYAICYNPENNSMMISTGKGLTELFLSTAVAGSKKSSAKAYPNPVRPDYFGYVTIEGLADNALVKIVDAGGGLIKEVGFAAGGEARWDVTNLHSKRVPGGVYYVLASGAPDGESFSTVAKILVVN